MLFPKTTANDLRKSAFITLMTICGFFVPSLLGNRGIFSLPSLGIITFIFLLFHSIFTFYTMEYPTKATVSEVITLPVKTIAVLVVIVIASWVGLNVLGLNRIGARILIVAGVSLIEFVFIYHSTLYLGILMNYLLKRRWGLMTVYKLVWYLDGGKGMPFPYPKFAWV